MASSIPSLFCQLLFFFFFFFFFLSLNVSCTNGDKHRRRLISVSSLLMNDTECFSSSSFDSEYGEKQSRIQVVHRHGPCSPLRQPKPLDHGRRVLEHDRRRVESLHGRRRQAQSSSRSYPGNSLAATMQGRYGLALGSADFVVTVGFGSPPQAMSVIFDTGSDISWIQCQPCSSCYTQKEPLFDPSNSSHYSPLSCDSSYCSSSSTLCVGFDQCEYTVKYGDGSQTYGLLSQDTLTLTSSHVLDDFVFGCGDDNRGFFGEVAGIIGLGRDHISLPSQSQTDGGAFSYCLPPYASSTGYLALGTSNGGRPNSPENLHFTSLLSRFDAPSFYFVELVGISVGGKDLRISPTSFSDPGTFIDSGTVLTYLPADAYSALRSEFRWRMREYPTSAGVDSLDTCYDLKGYDRVAVPAVVLHFSGGARLDVDGSGILFPLGSSSSIACLAFAETDPNGFSIIGNMQQKTYNIVYDVPNEKIGFGAGGCTADPF